MARRPAAAPPAHRPHRQHPPRRVLHRQALQPRLRARPARPARAARLRDAAAPADGARAGAAGALAGGPVLGRAVRAARSCAGAPSCTTGSCCRDFVDGRHRRRGRRPATRTASPSSTAWLDPFLEFRFPRIGQAEVGGRRHRAAGGHRAVARARRGGRRPAARRATSTRRSSACRCAVDGLVPARHVLTCNGVPVPLRPTGASARTSPACATGPGSRPRPCTPRSGSTRPLVFDLVDRVERALAGRLHLPRGAPRRTRLRTLPVNANEAEARRARTVRAAGHTPGNVDVARIEELERRIVRENTEYPRTLDLRRIQPA